MSRAPEERGRGAVLGTPRARNPLWMIPPFSLLASLPGRSGPQTVRLRSTYSPGHFSHRSPRRPGRRLGSALFAGIYLSRLFFLFGDRKCRKSERREASARLRRWLACRYRGGEVGDTRRGWRLGRGGPLPACLPSCESDFDCSGLSLPQTRSYCCAQSSLPDTAV